LTAEIPGVDVVTGGLAVGADTLAGFTNGINSIRAFTQHRYPAAVGNLLSAGLSFTGAGIGAKAVQTAIASAAALSSARSAAGTFAALDHALPEGAPALGPAAEARMNTLGAYQASSSAAALWGQATLAMGVNQLIVPGLEWLWQLSQ
jgi:hypothetical protein